MIKLMKILFIIAAVVFLFVFITSNHVDCDACSFDVDTLIEEYHKECIEKEVVYDLNLSNLSFLP